MKKARMSKGAVRAILGIVGMTSLGFLFGSLVIGGSGHDAGQASSEAAPGTVYSAATGIDPSLDNQTLPPIVEAYDGGRVGGGGSSLTPTGTAETTPVSSPELPRLTLTTSQPSLAEGGTAAVRLMLSAAPAGMSGFKITVASSDGAVVEITMVDLPAYGLTLTTPSSLPASVVTLTIVDLADIVRSEAVDVELATLTITAAGPGASTLTATILSMDDDQGEPVQVDDDSAVLTLDVAG